MTTTMTTNWQQATAAVQTAERIVIVTHIAPDGDAYGSALGLGNALRILGKQVDIAVDGGMSDYCAFLSGADTVLGKLERGDWHLCISVDASDESRTGEVGAYARAHSARVINLDHHATNTLFGDIHLVDPVAVSATQVIYDWLKSMPFELTQEVAMPLLTGLVTDTLGFRTSNVTAYTLNIAQHLMEAGASLTEITERTLDNRSYQSIVLWNRALDSVKLREGGIITAEVTRADLKAAGMTETGDSGLVSFLAKVNEAMISAVFKETPEGRIELSFRCKPGYDVSAVAFELGGGGHKQAAGATIDGPMEDAKKRVLALLRRAVRQGSLAIS